MSLVNKRGSLLRRRKDALGEPVSVNWWWFGVGNKQIVCLGFSGKGKMFIIDLCPVLLRGLILGESTSEVVVFIG